ncbi:MAG: AI-2E family transporter [Bdellovibrionales bacterium]|nr:AI-2E family transporter [Bdellovibrionales bacterium]
MGISSPIATPLRRPFTPVLTRIAVWGLLFSILYFLRSFFLLIFLTFVFAYIQGKAVNRLEKVISNRSIRVVAVCALFLGILIAIGFYIVPVFRSQAEIFAKNYPTYVERLDSEIIELSTQYDMLRPLLPKEMTIESADGALVVDATSSHSPTEYLLQQLVGVDAEKAKGGSLRAVLGAFKDVGGYLLAIGSAFFLALLFSFLVLLDLPRLTGKVRSLQQSRLGFVYDEVSPSLVTFGTVVGRALEAQFVIALVNTLLTAIGLLVIGIDEKIAFLSVVVFLCSFIPIVGVFISSLPICLVALQQSGFSLVIVVIVLITIIHLIEGYVLNPKIFGDHLEINPVLVLMILTIGGKLFGIWGLILGIPICNYIFLHAIQYEPEVER